MNSHELISVVVPNYNYGHYLPELFHCLTNQTYPHWECIIIDDGSSDNSIEIIKNQIAVDSRFKLHQQKNSGPAAARRNGISMCTGRYIQLIDADDFIHFDKFEAAIELYKSDPSIDIIYTDFRFVSSDRKEEWKEDYRRVELHKDAFEDFVSNWEEGLTIPIHSFLFRKECFEKWGSMDPNFKTHEDWDLHLLFSLQKAKYHFNAMIGAYYRVHPASSSRTNLTGNRRDTANVIAKYYLSNLTTAHHKKLIRRKYNRMLASWILERMRNRTLSVPQAMKNNFPDDVTAMTLLLSPFYIFKKFLTKIFR
jgi:glycosyltransferase involved in cell wall biosynthesis